MAVLVPETVPVNGGHVPAGVAAAAGGDEAPVGGGRLLYVANGGASPITVTVPTPGTYGGMPLGDVSGSVAAGAVWLLPLTGVLRGANGRASIAYTDVTSVTVAVLAPER